MKQNKTITINQVADEIVSMIFENGSFMSATIKFKEPCFLLDSLCDLRIRPIELKDGCGWQFKYGSKCINYAAGKGKELLGGLILNEALDQAHIMTAEQDYHCRIGRKGTILVSRSKKQLNREVNTEHNHQKDHPLTRKNFDLLLRVLGIKDEQNNLKPSMSAKYRQVNQFLRMIDAAWDECAALNRTKDTDQQQHVTVVDVGCGKAYLSFAVKGYLEATRNVKINFIGIDRNPKVIQSCTRMAETLGWSDSMSFVAEDIATFKPQTSLDIVLSLHACDTATDEALAFGVEHGAKLILSAPCCQHELQKTIGSNGKNKAILRNGILKERLADILTDAFRAQILRAVGYRTSVFEFIEPEATARNIMIRAIRINRHGTGMAINEYQDLIDDWGCIPYLATRLIPTHPELEYSPTSNK
jgi:SAM-dependent methyltransferase